jgi:hypothetical protein
MVLQMICVELNQPRHQKVALRVDTALRRMPIGNLGDARTLHSQKTAEDGRGSTMLAFSKMRVWSTIACSRSKAGYVDARG